MPSSTHPCCGSQKKRAIFTWATKTFTKVLPLAFYHGSLVRYSKAIHISLCRIFWLNDFIWVLCQGRHLKAQSHTFLTWKYSRLSHPLVFHIPPPPLWEQSKALLGSWGGMNWLNEVDMGVLLILWREKTSHTRCWPQLFWKALFHIFFFKKRVKVTAFTLSFWTLVAQRSIICTTTLAGAAFHRIRV